MTNVNQNTAQNSSNEYFNIHTRGLCYINRFREVPTRKGTFFSVTLGFLRGHVDEVEYTYIDTVIRNEEVLEILNQYQDAINAENSKVIAVATVGDIYADTFKKRNGDTVAGIKGRLIGLSQLKIDGQVVYSKSDDPTFDNQSLPAQQAPAEFAPRAIKQVQAIQVKKPGNAQAQNQASPVETAPRAYQRAQVVEQAPARKTVVAPANFEGEFLDVVKLDKNDPNFIAIKDQLKANGYRWNKELTAWVLAA